MWTSKAHFPHRIAHRPARRAAYNHWHAFNLQPGVFSQSFPARDLERELKCLADDRRKLPQSYLDCLDAPRVLLASLRLGDFDDAFRDREFVHRGRVTLYRFSL